MTIEELDQHPPHEWHGMIKQYVESTERVHGVVLYYKLLEFYDTQDRFLPGTEEEWRILDILEALTGYCSPECWIGTGDYHILE